MRLRDDDGAVTPEARALLLEWPAAPDPLWSGSILYTEPLARRAEQACATLPFGARLMLNIEWDKAWREVRDATA